MGAVAIPLAEPSRAGGGMASSDTFAVLMFVPISVLQGAQAAAQQESIETSFADDTVWPSRSWVRSLALGADETE